MPPLLTGLTSGAVATTVSNLVGPGNSLLGAGAGALAAKWAMRSTPVALALLAAGAGVRYWLKKRDETPAKAAASSRRAARPAAKRKPRARKPAAA